MEKTNSRYTWLNTLSLLLVLPTVYFIIISVLKYGLGLDGPYDSAEPLLLQLGIDESLGLNINLLILFGPLLALGLTVWQILRIDWNFNNEEFDFRIRVLKKWFPLFIAFLSVLVLATLFIYLVGENS